MFFNSFTFAGFFAVVFLMYVWTMRRLRLQNTLLLVASYVFYGWWDWRFLGLIMVSTIVDFVCGRVIDKRSDSPGVDPAARAYTHSPRVRRAVLFTSVSANLGILGFFKYYDFFAASAAECLTAIGLPLQPRLLELILPVGISFYTFQTLSYTIDVYRGKLRAHLDLLDFSVFVAFFPQLVAGPIVRASELLPQVAKRRQLRLGRFYEGGYLIFWGLFKKIVIADNLAVLVDRTFDNYDSVLGGAVVVALYAFAIQIYCDFSGYSDIARGCAKMMGFDIRLNFNLPYFATNPQEFWRRWHISLSSWLRDYLYVPLGGNRKGTRRTCINVMLTMILGGLWHGAAWTFVLWGVYQGVLLTAHRAAMPWIKAVTDGWTERRRRVGHWIAVVVFFQFVCRGWLIFGPDSIEQIGTMLASIVSPWPWWILSGANTIQGTGLLTLIAFATPLIAMQVAQHVKGDLNILLRMPAPVRGLAYAMMFFGMVFFAEHADQPFIYFQF